MDNNGMMEKEEIFSKVLRAGRRTYFFDVRSTKAGDYYLTITESKKFTKEDFSEFNTILKEMTDYIINEKGDEVISERHQKDFKKEEYTGESAVSDETSKSAERFTDIDFDDI